MAGLPFTKNKIGNSALFTGTKCSTHYIALQIKNSMRNVSTFNLITTEITKAIIHLLLINTYAVVEKGMGHKGGER